MKVHETNFDIKKQFDYNSYKVEGIILNTNDDGFKEYMYVNLKSESCFCIDTYDNGKRFFETSELENLEKGKAELIEDIDRLILAVNKRDDIIERLEKIIESLDLKKSLDAMPSEENTVCSGAMVSEEFVLKLIEVIAGK